MNWLVIAPDVKNENLKQVEEFLEKKHGITPFEVFIYEGVPKDELYDDLTHILQTTHCVIVDSNQMKDYPDYVYVLGALAGNLASEKVYDEEENLIQNSWATHLEFKLEDWENSEHTWRVETKVGNPLAVNGYAANDEGTTLVIMRWSQSNTVDFCIDNITFYDKEGNSMPIIYDAAANPAEIGELNTPAEVPPTEGSSAE